MSHSPKKALLYKPPNGRDEEANAGEGNVVTKNDPSFVE
jgi:hypothetical protein